MSTWDLSQATNSTPEQSCSPTPCTSLPLITRLQENGTRNGGAGENLGAEESLILLLWDSVALFAPYGHRSQVLYAIWCMTLSKLRCPCIPLP